jgi:hypothetical protein
VESGLAFHVSKTLSAALEEKHVVRKSAAAATIIWSDLHDFDPTRTMHALALELPKRCKLSGSQSCKCFFANLKTGIRRWQGERTSSGPLQIAALRRLANFRGAPFCPDCPIRGCPNRQFDYLLDIKNKLEFRGESFLTVSQWK